MSRYFGLIALVLLTASWEVAGDELDGKGGVKFFGCFKNVDAVCSDRLKGGKEQRLKWAVRLYEGKRRITHALLVLVHNVVIMVNTGQSAPQVSIGHCPSQLRSSILTDLKLPQNPNHYMTIPAGDVPNCQADG
ncbi:hypothetical protein Pst134EA_032067 [Puccinia striiformis f. sp. tritici]|uniref:uncharacterized protein n=1 Tax=Puccinia striiformis f. sp. tritici TaxID=168172 RepID=UPI002007F062|nr:uncharacterized protein Pst134EA_032067 [Puccinia striiformis f. sp. tritici]KAH9441936.1 hypothetical protein Pst134EA_032067 [Puccinia striiformis f. sp. tritici]